MELTYQKVLESCHFNPGLAKNVCKILDVTDVPTTEVMSPRFEELHFLVDSPIAPMFLSKDEYKKITTEMAEIADTTQEIAATFRYAVEYLSNEVQLNLLKRMSEKAVSFREVTIGYLMSSLRPSHAELNTVFWNKLVSMGTAEDWYTTMLEYQIAENHNQCKKFVNQLALCIERETAKTQ